MNAIRTGVTALVACILVAGCGGGSSSSDNSRSSNGGDTTSNVDPISVGLPGDYANELTTSVTVCVPGTATCQTINNILVDTGSYGLRIIGTTLNIPLPEQTDVSDNPIGECALFADGYSWGPVASADVEVAGEVASNIPIQVIGVSTFPAAPSACSTGAGSPENTVATFGANGVLGIGTFIQDCGTACAMSSNEDIYFSCNDSTALCSSTTESTTNQVQNPVAHFAADNNGVIIELPSIPDTGQVTASGQLVFGIGTESNNGPGSAQVLTLDGDGNFTTTYAGASTDAFIDSGSNGLFFASSLTICNDYPDFYCPTSTENLSAEMIGLNNVSIMVPFSVANTDTLNAGYAAFNNLAGPAGSMLGGFFDWGIPFFYGRNVFFAIDGASTPDGPGPYVAY